MRLLLRSFLLLLLPFGAAAQLITGPLMADPARAASAPAGPTPSRLSHSSRALLGTTALSLPFFDDFTSPLAGAPSAANWQAATSDYPNLGSTIRYLGGGAYVSNRLAVDPLTRGTATLDGLRGNGLAYNTARATAYGQIDTLTSQPIDLAGLSAVSRVYLSFAWQAGSVVGAPSSSSSSQPVNLVLELLDADGRWVTAWSYASRGVATRFKQQILALDQPAYLHGNFRFRFRASGSQTLTTDAFGLDYIYVNSNRAANDTIFQDIATSRSLNSPLQPYSAMPVWQYNATPTAPLNPTLTTTLNSLTALGTTPTPVSWLGTVRELTTGGFAATWLTGGRPIVAAARQDVVPGDARTAPLPTTAAAKRFRYQLAVQTLERNPLTLPNDTISRDVELGNYYAYDDGTAESLVGLTASNTNPTSYLALGYTASKADQVKSLLVAPVFNNISVADGGDGNLPRSVIVAVWADANGKPASAPLATATLAVPNPLPTGQTFIEIPFVQPVPVSGRFYVGYGQVSSGQFLFYGLDLNNPLPDNTLFINTQGTAAADPWRVAQFPGAPGAPMFRPVMTNSVTTATSAPAVAAALSFAPNPTPPGAAVVVNGPAFRQATLLDVLGRPVWQQPAAEAGQPTLHLPAGLPGGVYLVRLTLADGSFVTRRLAVE